MGKNAYDSASRVVHLSAENIAALRGGAYSTGLQRVHLLHCSKCRKKVAAKETK